MPQTVSMGGERILANTPASDDERKTRIELAACYRLARREGRDELIYNHISARVPGLEHHRRRGCVLQGVTGGHE